MVETTQMSLTWRPFGLDKDVSSHRLSKQNTSVTTTPIAEIPDPSEDSKNNTHEIACKVLNIISVYKLEKLDDAHEKWMEGRPKFLEVIGAFIDKGIPIRMCLPAFPFKSANKVHKVLGPLPDKAEELSLQRLNTMCSEIGEVYAPGAKLTIISDGLVYNDLLTVSEKETWAYGQHLRAMSAKRCEHIDFSRLKDLVEIDLPETLDEVTYVANSTNFRRALLNQFGRDDFDPLVEIAENEDARLTWMGYKRFLENDLRYIYPVGDARSGNQYRRDAKYLAGEMIRRGYAFANAVKKNFPDYLRLSIHQSTGEHKVSLNLLPTTTSFTTPWHCSVAFKRDGTIVSAPRGDFEEDPAYEIAYSDGRPSHFVERDESGASWAAADMQNGVPKEVYGL